MIDLSSRRMALAPLSYRIIGIGGAGLQVIDRLKQSGAAPATLIAADTHQRQLAESGAGDKLLFGCGVAGGMGAGGDPEVGRAAFEENRSEVRRVSEGANLVIVLGGLGGGTASGALPLAVREAKETGALVIAVVTLPFTFEGKRRIAQADTALKALENHADLVLCFENDRMGEGVSPSAGIGEAFVEADRVMAGGVVALLDLLNGEGLIHLGFADLKAALPGVHARALFGFGMAEGSNRPFDALARALRNPLMDKGRMLAESDTIIVQVSGGAEMTLHEVELLMAELNRHVGEKTQILFGTSVSPRLSGWMSVMLLAAVKLPAAQEPKEPVSPVATGVSPSISTVGSLPLSAQTPPSAAFAVVDGGADLPATPAAPVNLSGNGLQVIGDEAHLEGFEELAAEEVPVATTSSEAVSFIQEEEHDTGEEEPLGATPAVEEEQVPSPQPSSSPFPPLRPRQPRAIRPEPGRELFSKSVQEEEGELPFAQASSTSVELPLEAETASQESDSVVHETVEHEPQPEIQSESEVSAETSVELSATAESAVLEEATAEQVDAAKIETQVEVPREENREQSQRGEPVEVAAGVPQKLPTQGTLKFEPVARGRFEKSEPTIVDGEDLDIPTYLRRNVRIRLRS